MNEEMERPPWWLSQSDGDDASDPTDPGSSSAAGGGGFADMWSLLGTFGNVAGNGLRPRVPATTPSMAIPASTPNAWCARCSLVCRLSPNRRVRRPPPGHWRVPAG